MQVFKKCVMFRKRLEWPVLGEPSQKDESDGYYSNLSRCQIWPEESSLVNGFIQTVSMQMKIDGYQNHRYPRIRRSSPDSMVAYKRLRGANSCRRRYDKLADERRPTNRALVLVVSLAVTTGPNVNSCSLVVHSKCLKNWRVPNNYSWWNLLIAAVCKKIVRIVVRSSLALAHTCDVTL